MGATQQTEEPAIGGFSILDDKGRLSLPKAVRESLDVHPGSSVAYIVLDHALLLIPQDIHLAELMERAAQALARAGLTTQDLLDELPRARAAVLAEAYSAEFLREMERQWAAAHPELPSEQPEA